MDGDELVGPLRLAIVDDDVWAREQLSGRLSEVPGLVVAGVHGGVDEFVEHAPPDVSLVILDVQLRTDPDVAENVRRVVASGRRVLLVSAYFTEESLRGALASGAGGFLPKSADLTELIEAIRLVEHGQFVLRGQAAMAILNDRSPTAPSFTRAETMFLTLRATGLPLRQVARRMNITYETAKSYSKVVLEKYRIAGRNVDSPVDLYNAAVADGIVTPRPPAP